MVEALITQADIQAAFEAGTIDNKVKHFMEMLADLSPIQQEEMVRLLEYYASLDPAQQAEYKLRNFGPETSTT